MLHTAADLLDNGVNIDEAGGFPIQAASHQRHHEMVLLLLEQGTDSQRLARGNNMS